MSIEEESSNIPIPAPRVVTEKRGCTIRRRKYKAYGTENGKTHISEAHRRVAKLISWCSYFDCPCPCAKVQPPLYRAGARCHPTHTSPTLPPFDPFPTRHRTHTPPPSSPQCPCPTRLSAWRPAARRVSPPPGSSSSSPPPSECRGSAACPHSARRHTQKERT